MVEALRYELPCETDVNRAAKTIWKDPDTLRFLQACSKAMGVIFALQEKACFSLSRNRELIPLCAADEYLAYGLTLIKNSCAHTYTEFAVWPVPLRRENSTAFESCEIGAAWFWRSLAGLETDILFGMDPLHLSALYEFEYSTFNSFFSYLKRQEIPFEIENYPAALPYSQQGVQADASCPLCLQINEETFMHGKDWRNSMGELLRLLRQEYPVSQVLFRDPGFKVTTAAEVVGEERGSPAALRSYHAPEKLQVYSHMYTFAHDLFDPDLGMEDSACYREYLIIRMRTDNSMDLSEISGFGDLRDYRNEYEDVFWDMIKRAEKIRQDHAEKKRILREYVLVLYMDEYTGEETVSPQDIMQGSVWGFEITGHRLDCYAAEDILPVLADVLEETEGIYDVPPLPERKKMTEAQRRDWENYSQRQK